MGGPRAWEGDIGVPWGEFIGWYLGEVMSIGDGWFDIGEAVGRETGGGMLLIGGGMLFGRLAAWLV